MRAPAVVLEPSADGAYDGRYHAGATVFSPPAGIAMTASQQLQAKSLGQRREAKNAYDAKQFERCAELFAALAHPDDIYGAACCSAMAGKTDQAFAQLERALAAGFSDPDGLEADEDLARLKSDRRWMKLVAKARGAAKQ